MSTTTTLVTDAGFAPNTEHHAFIPLSDLPANDNFCCVDIPSDGDPELLSGRLGDVKIIRVGFPSSADGRGFTIARRLRLMGFAGRLRARGHVLADQYAMARRSGFDEVEIDAALAARQPEDQWRARANWTAHDYQSRLRG